MLRIAVPNKGSLAEHAAKLFTEAGYQGRRDSRALVAIDEINSVEFFYLRPRDIATYVSSGAVDLGITGRDLLLDSSASAKEIKALGFGDSTFRFAAPAGIDSLDDLQGKRVATSYPQLVGDFLSKHGVSAELVRLEGAVESAVRLGVADVVADVVSTGATLRAAGLEIFGPVLLESTAVLIAGDTAFNAHETETVRLIKRLDGVQVARDYVMVEYDLPKAKLQQAVAISPGVEAPTVAPLATPDWVAVRVMVPKKLSAQIMDQLSELGAKAIIVTAIHAARL